MVALSSMDWRNFPVSLLLKADYLGLPKSPKPQFPTKVNKRVVTKCQKLAFKGIERVGFNTAGISIFRERLLKELFRLILLVIRS